MSSGLRERADLDRRDVAAGNCIPHSSWHDAFDQAAEAVRTRRVTAVLGDCGTGKSILMAELFARLSAAGERVVLVRHVGLEDEGDADVLLLDEADKVSPAALSRLCGGPARCVLAGLPTLEAELSALDEAPAVVLLGPIQPGELAGFVRSVLGRDHGAGATIDDRAVAALADASGGVPRDIVILTGLASFAAGLEDSENIVARHVEAAIRLRHGGEDYAPESAPLRLTSFAAPQSPALSIFEAQRDFGGLFDDVPAPGAAAQGAGPTVRGRRSRLLACCGAAAAMAGAAAVIHFWPDPAAPLFASDRTIASAQPGRPAADPPRAASWHLAPAAPPPAARAEPPVVAASPQTVAELPPQVADLAPAPRVEPPLAIQPPPLVVQEPLLQVADLAPPSSIEQSLAVQPPPLVVQEPTLQVAALAPALRIEPTLAIQPPPLVVQEPMLQVAALAPALRIEPTLAVQPPPLVVQEPTLQVAALAPAPRIEPTLAIQPPPLAVQEPLIQIAALAPAPRSEPTLAIQPPPLVVQEPLIQIAALAPAPRSERPLPIQPPPLVVQPPTQVVALAPTPRVEPPVVFAAPPPMMKDAPVQVAAVARPAAPPPTAGGLPVLAAYHVVVTYPGNDPAAAKRGQDFSDVLARQGVIVEQPRARAASSESGVLFFFAEDATNAGMVADEIDGAARPALRSGRGRKAAPGTIEIALPLKP